MKRVLSVGRALLQFFPLTVFLRVAFLHGQPQSADWLQAFVWGGAAALLQFALAVFFSRGQPLNRLVLGVNCYLVAGAVAVVSNQDALLKWLHDLKESGLFLCLLGVGLWTTVASRSGFVGATGAAAPREVRVYSMGLVVLAALAVAASFGFRGQILFSAAVPLIVLNVATRVFKRRLQSGVLVQPE
ncbi:MAG: hypothetical protein QM617_07355 [Comamonas sp.]